MKAPKVIEDFRAMIQHAQTLRKKSVTGRNCLGLLVLFGASEVGVEGKKRNLGEKY